MTTGQKVALGLGITITGIAIGWGIYEATRKNVSSGNTASEDTTDAAEEKPVVTVLKDVRNPDGTYTRHYSDGTKKKYTAAEMAEETRKAIAGRGADGWSS